MLKMEQVHLSVFFDVERAVAVDEGARTVIAVQIFLDVG
jgi:hypothetical protein